MRKGRATLLTLFFAWVPFGCSVLYDLSPDQCGSTSECESFGSNFVCDNGLCVARGGSSSGGSSQGGGSGKGGTDNGGSGGSGGTSGDSGSSGEGGSSGGGKGGSSSGGKGGSGGQGGSSATGGSSGEPPMGECETTADCEELRGDIFDIQPAACIEQIPGDAASRACVDLKTDQCPVLLPDVGQQLWLDNLRGQNPIILGAYAFMLESLTSAALRNYDLAFAEFDREQLGVPGPGGITRPFVVVVCKNNAPLAQSDLNASLDHLVSLRVPGVVAGLPSDDLQYAFSRVGGSASKILFMSPLESDSALANVQDEDLLWHLLPSGAYVALPYAPLLTRTIDYLIDTSAIGAKEVVRVALVTASDLRLLADVSDVIKDTVTFNGKSVDENLEDMNFREVIVPSVYQDANATLATQIQALLSFAPHIIIGSAADEFFSRIMPGVESGWASAAPSQARPFYLLSPYHSANAQEGTALAISPSIHLRMAGVAYASIPDNLRSILTSYNGRYDAQFPEDAGRRGFENYYDAPYYLMYGIVAGARNRTQFDGAHIATGMDRLLNGPVTYRIHPSDIAGVVGTLGNATSSITLNGTLGAPNFDGTGARTDPGSVFCFDPTLTPKARYDVLRYDNGNLVGDFTCIPDF